MKNFLRKLIAHALAVCLFSTGLQLRGQSAVLIPLPSEKPDPNVLSLAVMNVDILIDNQHATVNVMQIFDNHTTRTLEGKYVFALPGSASISDFAIWENTLRIPGVMMEKRRANEIYEQLKQPRIDPGILQATDEDESGAGFSAKIFPINAYGTKRLEMEYREELPIDGLTSRFSFPLKPSSGEKQFAGEFNLRLRVLNDFPIAPSLPGQGPYALQVTKSEPNEFEGEFHGSNVELNDDFTFDYRLDIQQNSLSVITHRAPERISAYDLRDPRLASAEPDGYFQAHAVFAMDPPKVKPPKHLILLLDTSLSMHGDKLVRAVKAIDFFLHSLTPDDEFNLILFNEDATAFMPKPAPAATATVENAMDYIKNASLLGGTNIKKALETALAQSAFFPNGDGSIVMISDGEPTLETTRTKAISAVFNGQKTRFYAFGLGTDTNDSLFSELAAKTRGYFDQARETEDISARLRFFFDKVSASGLEDLKLASSSPKDLYDIYPSGDGSYSGSDFSFTGRYRGTGTRTITLSANNGSDPVQLSREADFPEAEAAHAHLPRVWAKARISALLQQMNIDGEREDLIAEIIALSEKYKIVTPYTAFLAAPRALLRPRLIQPGDPVIRVKTDPSVTQVFAVLPFGETLPLKYLENEGVWETRFLAPEWMADGAYKCRLLLTDRTGNGYQEEKTFVIDSRAPKVKIALDKEVYSAGEEINVKASADSDTYRLTAKIYGAKPADMRWNGAAKINTGILKLPGDLASGKYVITVTAEDFAHNQSTAETRIEVIGK